MKKNFLVLAGLLVAGLGLTACGGSNNTPDKESTDAQTTESTKTEVETETETKTETKTEEGEGEGEGEGGETVENKGVFVSGVTNIMGFDFTADFYLVDSKKVKLDIWAPESEGTMMYQQMFDREGTWSVGEDGNVKLDIVTPGKDGAEESHNEVVLTKGADNKYTGNYVIAGPDGEFVFDLSGEWCYTNPIATGSFEIEFGTFAGNVILTSGNTYMIDVVVGVPAMEEAFDVTGTYTLANGVFTLKGVAASGTELPAITLAPDATNTLKTTVTVMGQGDTPIEFEVAGKFENSYKAA